MRLQRCSIITCCAMRRCVGCCRMSSIEGRLADRNHHNPRHRVWLEGQAKEFSCFQLETASATSHRLSPTHSLYDGHDHHLGHRTCLSPKEPVRPTPPVLPEKPPGPSAEVHRWPR